MTSASTNGFTHAQERERDLTARQREVLALLGEGRTNPEIAEALGLTLWGAKWHVSEILSKLGLTSREQAAEYWRWSRRPLRRMRGWLAVPALSLPKAAIVAGGAASATLAVAAVFAFGALSSRAQSRSGPETPFWLEARTTETSVSYLYPPSAVPQSGQRVMETLEFAHTWSFGDSTHSRAATALLAGGGARTPATELVADGSFLWRLHDHATYSRGAIPSQPTALAGLSNGAQVGPLRDASVAALVSRLASDSGADGHAAVAGRETILGRKTTIIDYGPTSWTRAASGGWDTGGSRIWVDEERMFILQSESARGLGSSSRTVVTALRYGEPQPPSAFVFAPPAGARELPPDLACQPAAGSAVPVGFLGFDLAPGPDGRIEPLPGVVLVTRQAGRASPGGCAGVTLTLQPPGEQRTDLGGRFVIVSQANDGTLPSREVLEGVSHLRPDGSTATVGRTDGDQAIVAWEAGGLAVEARSNFLTPTDLAALTDRLVLAK